MSERARPESATPGDAAPRGRAPLGGVRILAVSQFGAGPFGTQVLADLGAEVVKTAGAVAGPEPAPRLGEHTDHHLREVLGYSGRTIEALRGKGAIG